MPSKYCKKQDCPSDEELLKLYLDYGLDKNPKINRSVLQSLSKDCELELTPFEAKIIFNSIDADKNGKVTFLEFKKMMTKVVEEDFDESFFVDLFVAFLRTLDADGNGYVSKEELEKAFEEKFEEGAFEILTIMADENGDGRISIEEAAKALVEAGDIFS